MRRIAREAVEDLDRENVRLAELRFSPHFLCEPGGLDWDGAMDAVVAGVHEAVRSWSGDCVDVRQLVALIRETYGDRGYARLYQREVLQADEGCDFDFLRSQPERD